MLIALILGRMASETTNENAIVSTKAIAKLTRWMSRPNIISSTSAVTTTKLSIPMPSTQPTSAPIMVSSIVSRNM